VAVPTLCRDCLPDFQPAVLYPQLRRVAIGRADRLGDILVGKKSPDCRHQTPTRFLVAGYKNDRHIGPSIADQIYQLILERELPVEAINAL